MRKSGRTGHGRIPSICPWVCSMRLAGAAGGIGWSWVGIENDQRRRKRRRIFVPPEFEPPAKKSNRAFCCVVVPPRRICPRWHEAHDERACLRGLVGFAHPVADCTAIRRVHPYLAAPRLGQPIFRQREVAGALVIVRPSARVEVERPKLRAALVIEVLRCCPFTRCGREMH